MPGDINNDGNISVSDVQCIVLAAADMGSIYQSDCVNPKLY